MSIYKGIAEMGSILSGGGADTETAFMDGRSKRASLENVLATARIKRDEALARSEIQSKLIANGASPTAADMISTIMRSGAGTDYAAAQQGIGRGQENQARGVALEDLMAGVADPTRMNRALAISHSAPLQTATIDEGNILDPHGATTQNIEQTPGGLASIMAKEAQASASSATAGARNAQADASKARAENTRDHTANPGKYKTAPKSKVESTGKPKVGESRKGYRFKGGDPGKKSSWVKE